MKRISNPLLRGKAALLMLGLAAGITLVMPACKKDDKDTKAQQAVTEAEANEVVTSTISRTVSTQVETAASLAVGFGGGAGARAADCGYSDSNNLTFSGSSNGFTISLDYAYSFVLSCGTDNATYQSLQFTFDGKTDISGSKFAMSDSSNADFTVTGLDDASKSLVFNQTLNHAGNYTSKSGGNTFSNVIAYTAKDVKVTKTYPYMIESGTAALTISGKTASGKSFSYAGVVTFKGKNTATFAITGGSTFDLTW